MVSEKRKIGDSCNGSTSYCLPDDVIMIILLCLPADILHNVMRLVCKKWNNLIKSPPFISSHFQKDSTTNDLLIRHNYPFGYLVKPRSDSRVVEVKELNFPFVKRVCASCNGLLFIVGPIERTKDCPSYILNPLTKQYLPLPLFPRDVLEREKCCFGYIAGSRVYKVMHYTDEQSRCLILTIGVDKAWREVNISQLSDTSKQILKFAFSCFTSRGSVYWLLRKFPFILCFDMETETFREISFPSQLTHGSGLIVMEDSVSLWVHKSTKKCLFKFWLLKDTKTGQWEKFLDINLESERHLPDDIMPLCWLRSRELLVLRTRKEYFVYNVNTQQLHQTEEMTNDNFFGGFFSHVHVNSLVPLNNLSLDLTPQLPYKSTEEVYSEERMRSDIQEFKK